MFRNRSLIFRILLIICLPVALLLTNVEVSTFDREFFSDKYIEHNIVEETGMSKEDLMMVTDELLNYLKGNRKDLIIFAEIDGVRQEVFNEREIHHMEDVLYLFKRGTLIRNIAVFLSIFSLAYIVRFDRKKLSKTLITCSLIPIGLMAILSILITIDYNKYFTYFHEILFTNDLWLLDPNTDTLIQMLPLEFFSSITFKIIILFIIELLILLTMGIVLAKSKYIYKLIRKV